MGLVVSYEGVLKPFLPLGREGYCNHSVCLSGVWCLSDVCLSTFLVRSDFSESVRVRKLKFGTNDVYITI